MLALRWAPIDTEVGSMVHAGVVGTKMEAGGANLEEKSVFKNLENKQTQGTSSKNAIPAKAVLQIVYGICKVTL